jgi:RHS repeat-associated protein
VSYNPATNQPYNGNYDANGNAPVGTWNVENKLVGQVLDGTQVNWSYDPFGQRVARYKSSGSWWSEWDGHWDFYLYGPTGQRMVQIGCDTISGQQIGGSSWCVSEGTDVYFGGKLIAETDASGQVLAPTDRLGTVRGVNTNGTMAQPTYYPYGEPKTAGGIDRQQQFGTYVRDSTPSAQDYAGQRYYSNNTGRFFSADPSMDNVDYANPGTWNAYVYGNDDPVGLNDPTGLVACGDLINGATGTSVSSIMTTYNDLGYLAQTIWHEGGPLWKTDSTDVNDFVTQQAYIATALENRYAIANGTLTAYTSTGGTVSPALFAGTSLTATILQAAGNNQSWGICTNGQLNNMATLKQVLSTDISVGTQVQLLPGSDFTVNSQCFAAISAVTEALLAQEGVRTEPNGVILAYWNLATNNSPATGTTTVPSISLNGDTFYGYFSTPQPRPVRRPPPGRPGKPGRPGPL